MACCPDRDQLLLLPCHPVSGINLDSQNTAGGSTCCYDCVVAPAQLPQAPAQGVPAPARPLTGSTGSVGGWRGGAGGAWSPCRQLPPCRREAVSASGSMGRRWSKARAWDGEARVRSLAYLRAQQASSPHRSPKGSLQLQEGALGPWGFPAPFLFLDRILHQVGTVGCPAAGASAAAQRWGRGEEEASSPCPRERVAEQGQQTGECTCSCVCGWRGGITHGASIVWNGRNGSWDQNLYKSLE